MTRELTREEDWQVTLAFDATTPAVNAEQFERAVNFTASLIDWLIARGAALRLLVSAPRLAQNVPEASPVLSGYGAGRAHGLSLLAALARVEMPPPASEQNELINAPDWMARLGHALQRVSLAEQHTPLTTADGLAELADLRDGRSTLMVVTPVSRDALPTWLTTTQVFCFAEL